MKTQVLTAILALSVWASHSVAFADIDCEAKMTAGKYKGQCIDTSVKKSPYILEEDGSHIQIMNFRHEGRFMMADIPYQDIEKVSYVTVDLNAHPLNTLGLINVSHTQLRYQLKPGSVVKLADGTVAPINDFFMSLNYMAPKGVPYDPVKGLKRDLYASVLQIFSAHDEVQTRFVKQKFNMYEIDLNLNPHQAAELLKTALNTANTKKYSLPYDTWGSNCTTVLFDLLDSSLKLDVKPYRFTLSKIRDTGLVPAMRALGDRGLVDANSPVKLVNSEFGYLSFPSKSNRYFVPLIDKTYAEIK